MKKIYSVVLSLVAFFAVTVPALAQHWAPTWASSQQLVEPANSIQAEDLHDVTLRQIIHPTINGKRVMLRVSNRFGAAPLRIGPIRIAKAVQAGTSKIAVASERPVTFSGAPTVLVPTGADYLSDAIDFPVTALADIAITMHFDDMPAEQTGHPGARMTTFIVHGDQISAPEFTDPKKNEHWYYITALETDAAPGATAIVTLGDSITDGRGSTPDGSNRWPDILTRRLQENPSTHNIAVLNHGIGGNRVLDDKIGPNALSRLDRDVFAEANVRWIVLLEGVNDLGVLTRNSEVSQAGHDAFVQRLIAAYEQIIVRAHLHGIKVVGTTILPFGGSFYYHPPTDADRVKINDWIRAPGHFDAFVDFDKITRDPAQPDHLLAAYDSGDHLHPSVAGYAAMGESIPLSLFNDAAVAMSAAPVKGTTRLAFTFDDLPAHGPLPPGETRVDIINKITTALKQAKVPATYGFINGHLLEQHPEDEDALKAWKDSGNPLGNHTYSHWNINQVALADFSADTVRNEAVLDKLMKKGDWHWFRYPFLSEGDTPEKRAGVRQALADRKYKVAGVTMSFGDYLWPETYARCLTKGDAQGVQALKDAYLRAAGESLAYARASSDALYGRQIPLVILMHVGASTADMLPQLLAYYRSQGVKFVPLEKAERDEFYRNDIDLKLPVSADTFEAVARERGVTLPARPGPPMEFAAMCR